MKKTILAALFAVISATSALTIGDSMKLVNINNGYVVVEFKDGQPQFHDRFLEAEMKESGILIPPSMMEEFHGKEIVLLGDPLFEKAFKEVYYPLCIKGSIYKWQN